MIGRYQPSTTLKNLEAPQDPIINVRIMNIGDIQNRIRYIIDRHNIIIYSYVFASIENLYDFPKSISGFAIAGNEKRTSGAIFQLLVRELHQVRNGLAELLQM